MTFKRPPRARPALDFADLERLALGYVSRYATSRAKLRDYLSRKLTEQGWVEEGGDWDRAAAREVVEQLVGRFAQLGYVDDRALAEARARSFATRGYGARRLSGALHALGIDEADAASARLQADENAWDAALRFARRRRIGPFAEQIPDEAGRRRAFAAMMRAGHPPELAKAIVGAAPGDVPARDD